jgi:hypothetical protein
MRAISEQTKRTSAGVKFVSVVSTVQECPVRFKSFFTDFAI